MNTGLPMSDSAATVPGTAEVTGKEVLDMSISRHGKDHGDDKQHFDTTGKTTVRSNPVNVWTLVWETGNWRTQPPFQSERIDSFLSRTINEADRIRKIKIANLVYALQRYSFR
jgi:hypothetical protein